MLKYEKQDLDGNPLRVKVKYKVGVYDTDTLDLSIKKCKTIFGITIWYEVHESGLWANRVSHWDCERIEKWVDKEVDDYNRQIINERERNKLYSVVEKGDCG